MIKKINWTTDKIETLISLRKNKTKKEIMNILSLTEGQYRSACYRFKLNENQSKRWTSKEIEYLKNVYSNAVYNEDINLNYAAEILNRDKSNICRKARELGLTDISRKKKKVTIKKIRKFKTDDELKAHISKRTKRYLKENGHPKGMKGKKHSKQTKEILSKKSKEMFKNRTKEEQKKISIKAMKTREKNGIIHNKHGSWKAGWRNIGGIDKYYRSRWEANYARYLEWLRLKGEIKKWEHEPETFYFEKIKRGTVSYLPDFRVEENNGEIVYHEVKGWMDARSKTKIKRMKKYYPEIKLIVIQAKEYNEIKKKISSLLDGWETDSKGR